LASIDIKIIKNLQNGLTFSCKMCGNCCRGHDEGEVYLYEDDIKRLASHLHYNGKIGLAKFCSNYLKVVDESFFWKAPGAQRGKTYRFKTLAFKFIGDDEHCQFLKDNKCSVHEYRPFQCQCFPFWKMMVESQKNLVSYAKKCPGLKDSFDHKGSFYDKDEILEWARKEQEIELNYFLKIKICKFDISRVYPFLSKELMQSK
jgi:Fe-S-cluster containining protein